MMPRYPPLAAVARVEGEVKISFRLDEKGNVSSADVLSGHPMLRESAAEIVRSWKFDLPKELYRTEWKYDTIFSYHMSGREVDQGQNLRLTIVMDSFKHFEITSDTFKPAAMASY
jgi:TonB family protein